MSPPSQPNPPPLTAHPFTTIPAARAVISQHLNRLLAGTSRSQYLLFKPVSESHFTSFDDGRYDGRRTIPKCTRLSYYADKEELVVKLMGTSELELSHHHLEARILFKVRGLGMEVGGDLMPTGTATRKGGSESKEPDSSYVPFYRGKDGWPSVVVGVGFEESLELIREDARWWLLNSGGGVGIAVIIILHLDDRKIVVEAWETPVLDEARRLTRSRARQLQTPTRTQEVCIEKSDVRGAPLVLGFEKVFGRAAVFGEGEGDIVFSAEDLGKWADTVWWDDQG